MEEPKLITAEKFNSLKEAVKLECERRTQQGYYGGSPVKDFAGSAYDYTSVPTSGQKILKEHYEKIAEPLNAINSDIFPNISGDKPILEQEFEYMDTFIQTYSTANLWSANQEDSGCKEGCTGLCAGYCRDACTSCGGICSSGCSSCSGTCRGTCSKTCTGKCDTTCTHNCGGNGCYESCDGTCTGECSKTCTSDCAVYCGGDCATHAY